MAGTTTVASLPLTRVRRSTWLLVGMAITMAAAAPMRWVTLQAPLAPSTGMHGLDVGGRATMVIGLVILGTVGSCPVSGDRGTAHRAALVFAAAS